MHVYDQLDILTFIQTTGAATVEKFDAEVDDISTTGVSTNVLDLEAVAPNFIGQSVYIVPRQDAKGGTIGGTGNPMLIATLFSGAADNAVATEHGSEKQVAASDVLEIPLAVGTKRFIKVTVKSNGGGGSNAINAGAVQVFIGKSGEKA